MSFFDLNTAEQSTGGGSELIPDGTVARAMVTIRPGGAGEGGWLKESRSGSLMLDTEWTITEGKYAKRKVWAYMTITGSEKGASITRQQLRALVEGHFGLKADDMSEAAQAKRRVSIDQLSGMEGCVLIGIEKGTDGYADKNRIKAVIAPGEGKYIAAGQSAGAPATAAPKHQSYDYAPMAASAATAPAPASSEASGGNRPAWG